MIPPFCLASRKGCAVFPGGQRRTRRVYHDKARSGVGGLNQSELDALVNWGLGRLIVCERGTGGLIHANL
jgi:hypothetical protein